MRRQDLHHAVIANLERLPAPHDAHYGVVPLPPPEEAIALGAFAPVHRRALEALGQANGLARDLGDPFMVSRLLARREAVSSSSIEGTNSTLDELLTLEEDAAEELRDATAQVRDYALALDRLVPRAIIEGHDIFTAELVQELHREVMRGNPDYQDEPGQWRQIAVWIGGPNIAYSSYNPAPPARIEAGLTDTLAYMRGEGMQVMAQSLIARMAIAHAHFEAVHPFRDGNGRVGRLLLPLMMAAEGAIPLYLSPYIEAHKPAYYASLKAAQQQLDWAAVIGFISDAIIGTVDELIATRSALQRLADAWAARRRFRQGSAALRALEVLMGHPVITVRRLAARLEVSVPAATAAIEQLEAVGIIEERTGYRRNRIFAAPEVLALLNRPFGAEPL